MNPGTVVPSGMALLSAFMSLVLTVWFVVFTILVVNKLSRIIELLSQKDE